MTGERKRKFEDWEGPRVAERALRRWAIAVNPDHMTVDQAAALIKIMAGIERIVAGVRLRLAARRDDAGGPGEAGERSTADWLGKVTGQPPSSARDDIEASKALRDLPDTDEAVRAGELSPTQARHVTKGA